MFVCFYCKIYFWIYLFVYLDISRYVKAIMCINVNKFTVLVNKCTVHVIKIHSYSIFLQNLQF